MGVDSGNGVQNQSIDEFDGDPMRRVLQCQEVTKAWMRVVLVVELDCERRSLEILWGWKNAVWVLVFTWGLIERELSRETQRLLTCVYRRTGKPSTVMLGESGFEADEHELCLVDVEFEEVHVL